MIFDFLEQYLQLLTQVPVNKTPKLLVFHPHQSATCCPLGQKIFWYYMCSIQCTAELMWDTNLLKLKTTLICEFLSWVYVLGVIKTPSPNEQHSSIRLPLAEDITTPIWLVTNINNKQWVTSCNLRMQCTFLLHMVRSTNHVQSSCYALYPLF